MDKKKFFTNLREWRWKVKMQKQKGNGGGLGTTMHNTVRSGLGIKVKESSSSYRYSLFFCFNYFILFFHCSGKKKQNKKTYIHLQNKNFSLLYSSIWCWQCLTQFGPKYIFEYLIEYLINLIPRHYSYITGLNNTVFLEGISLPLKRQASTGFL